MAMLKTKLNVLPQAQPWYADGLKFQCTQCGNCCTGGPGYVWISDTEIERLAEHLRLSREVVLERFCRRVGDRYSLQEGRNARGEYDCVFLREIPAEAGAAGQVAQSRRVCGIYEARPLQCRTWPFWDGNLASSENWRRAAHRCPGIDQGKLHDRAHVEAMRDAKDWPSS